MNISLTRLTILLCSIAPLVFGCASNKPYRTTAQEWIESTDEYRLGFVELDEQGWFWNRKQKDDVQALIRREGNIGQTNAAQGLLVVVFVHGWKNNASTNNGNVVSFRDTLKELGKAETVQTNHEPRKVVGVYVGWRGLSATVEPFKELSLWGRKATAHKVGGYGAMTELLVDLEKLQQESNDSLATNAPRSELIIVGHSFGAAAVYSAISQIVTEGFVDTIKLGKPLKPLGDQVILLNPAFEASRHFDLNDMATNIMTYPTNQRPVLSIFTSKGDWATHYFFPMGRFFSTMFELNRSKYQKHSEREAIGWFEPFQTHTLEYKTNAAALAVEAPHLPKSIRKKVQPRSRTQMKEAMDIVQTQRAKWKPNNIQAQTYYFQNSILRPKKNYRPGNPILIVSVDSKMMEDHDDITNPRMLSFLGDYILFCQKEPAPKTTAPAK